MNIIMHIFSSCPISLVFWYLFASCENLRKHFQIYILCKIWNLDDMKVIKRKSLSPLFLVHGINNKMNTSDIL
jgi:hypothetical protein